MFIRIGASISIIEWWHTVWQQCIRVCGAWCDGFVRGTALCVLTMWSVGGIKRDGYPPLHRWGDTHPTCCIPRALLYSVTLDHTLPASRCCRVFADAPDLNPFYLCCRGWRVGCSTCSRPPGCWPTQRSSTPSTTPMPRRGAAWPPNRCVLCARCCLCAVVLII
jgi:hypothetical protein